jgi:hypothetical protein
MLDHYLICLESCTTTQQIDALANKAFDHLKVEDFSKFIDKAIELLDKMLGNITVIKSSSI